MLRLVGAMLCLALCLATPAPPKGCASTSLILETLRNIRTLKSKGSIEITPPVLDVNQAIQRLCERDELEGYELVCAERRCAGLGYCNNNMMEEEGTVSTYLEGFIQALKSSKGKSKERLKLVWKLQKIHVDIKSCLGWMEWEPVEEEDFFSNLEYLLRFLNHNAPSEDRM